MNETRSYIIETDRLTKHFGQVKAVDGVTLNVRKGEIYGFLGLNGAGKTTTIRMLLGMIRPFSGESRLFGEPIVSGRQGPWNKVGYLVELPYSYPELTVSENLATVCRYRGLDVKKSAPRVIEKLKLGEYSGVKAKNLSLGNAQRLGLAKALIHDPELLVLDEPSNGLDPSGIVEIRELLTGLAHNRGITVFISSHNLGEISKIATRIGIIHRGKLAQEIDADKLESFLKKRLLVGCADVKKAAKVLAEKSFSPEFQDDGTISLGETRAVEDPEGINRLLVASGNAPRMLVVEKEDLETYFLRVTGEAS